MSSREKRNGARLKDELARKRKESPGAFWTYVILRFIVIVILVRCILRADYESAFVCVFVLVVFLLPQLIEKKLPIDIPNTLEIIIMVFVFAAEIMGELQCYFIKYSHWDTLLHTSWGFLCAALGFSLVDLLNRSESVKFELSPFFLALVAFCFSMTVGVFWEFVEFGIDRIFLMDMQKDTVLHTISSVTLDETNSNIPIIVKGITDMSINGESLGLGGYLDIGLYDTMEDLFVNFIGAITFSVIGFFEAKSPNRPFTTALTPRRRRTADDANTDPDWDEA